MKLPIASALAILFLSLPSSLASEGFEWVDRRPIGAIYLATSGKNWPKNPRGYFNDPEMDVTTDAGRQLLRTRMLKLADDSIARVKEVGAQGVIVWDIEGGEMPHAVTYLGDPRVLPRVAPEMEAIADEFFGKFRQAGVPTGVCIRPSTIVFKDPEDPSKYPWIKGRYGHTDGPEPVKNLSNKIDYARKRWGSTIFYMDTNYTPRFVDGVMQRKALGTPDFRMLSSEEMAELAKLQPGVLIWPEFQEPDYFASCSGYGEYRQIGKFSAVAREKYPKAFRVWQPRILPEDIYSSWEEFIGNGVLQGEVFLFECYPSMSAMGDVLRNAGAEVALRKAPVPFVVKEGELSAQLAAEKDWARRRLVIEAMGRKPQPAATETLARLVQTETNGLQWFAARSLAMQPGGAAWEALKSVASSKGTGRIPAVRALGASSNPEALPLLVSLLGAEPEVRWAAIDAAGELGNSEATPALLELLRSLKGTPATRSREKIIRALGRLGDPAAVLALQLAEKEKEFMQLRPLLKEVLKRLLPSGGANR